jgi:hypothetical protein
MGFCEKKCSAKVQKILENSQTSNTFFQAKDATQKIKKVQKQQKLINI